VGAEGGKKRPPRKHPKMFEKTLSTTRLFESEIWKYWQNILHRKILSCHGNGRIALELLKLKIVVG